MGKKYVFILVDCSGSLKIDSVETLGALNEVIRELTGELDKLDGVSHGVIKYSDGKVKQSVMRYEYNGEILTVLDLGYFQGEFFGFSKGGDFNVSRRNQKGDSRQIHARHLQAF